jgi:hypothetical protein
MKNLLWFIPFIIFDLILVIFGSFPVPNPLSYFWQQVIMQAFLVSIICLFIGISKLTK